MSPSASHTHAPCGKGTLDCGTVLPRYASNSESAGSRDKEPHVFVVSVVGAARALGLLFATTDESAPLSGEALVQALRGGGYNLYFRHAATDWSQSDHVRTAGDWTSCEPSRIRQLSDAGRRTAREVGQAIRALAIPVGRVLASPYCRTVETARLMGLGPVESTTDIMNMRVAEYFGGRAAIARRARARLAIPPSPGTNTVLVAHGNVAREATDVYPGEGEGAVFHPDGSGGFVFVGKLSPEQWMRLAEELASEKATTP